MESEDVSTPSELATGDRRVGYEAIVVSQIVGIAALTTNTNVTAIARVASAGGRRR